MRRGGAGLSLDGPGTGAILEPSSITGTGGTDDP